jgi:mRNA interferase MazF
MEISRGDLVITTLPGDYGKPRPVLVVQDDAFRMVPSLTVLPLTSDLRNDSPLLRINVNADSETGLQTRSQIMVDKTGTVRRDRVTRHIGRVDLVTMRAAGAALAKFLGLD